MNGPSLITRSSTILLQTINTIKRSTPQRCAQHKRNSCVSGYRNYRQLFVEACNRDSIYRRIFRRVNVWMNDGVFMRPFRSAFSTKSELPRVYLLTKEDCSLCDDAKEVLEPIRHKFMLEEVDITLPENKHWYNKYKYDIPVFYIYDEFICKHRVDLKTFETALDKYKDGGKAK